jgi:PBSX family phage terminase large subunit
MTAAMSDKQLDYLRHSTADVNVCDGSISSGKTIVTLARWLLFVAHAPRTGELVMVGRTRESIWRNLIGPLQTTELYGAMADAVIGNVGAPTVSIMGRRVHLIGASDAKAEKTIRGMTVAGAYVDEITTIPEEFFTQLLGRMRVTGAKLFGSTNPDNPAHWFKAKFLDRIDQLAGWRHWHFTMADNLHNPPGFEEKKRQEFTGLWLRRFVNGEWVAADGAVYPMWDPDRHVTPWADLPRMERLLAVGMDYGTNNPTAALLLGIAPDYDEHGYKTRRRLYLIDEWGTPKGHGLDDVELSRRYREWLHTPHLPAGQHLEPEYTVVDPSAASFKTRLYLDGVQNLHNADNDVSYGVKLTASLLANDNLIVSDRCRGLIQEVTGYSWDEKAAAAGKDQPVKVADHYLDAARYALTTTETLWSDLITAA